MFPTLWAAFSCSKTYWYCPAHRPLRTADQPSGRFHRDGAEVTVRELNPKDQLWNLHCNRWAPPCGLQQPEVSPCRRLMCPGGSVPKRRVACADPHLMLHGALLGRALRAVPFLTASRPSSSLSLSHWPRGWGLHVAFHLEAAAAAPRPLPVPRDPAPGSASLLPLIKDPQQQTG